MPAFDNSTDLVTEVLFRLGVLASGQAPDPEDVATVTNRLDAIFRLLTALEITYVADPTNIPNEWFLPLADIVAGEMASPFGLTPDDVVKLKNLGLGGTQETDIGKGAAAIALYQINRSRPTYEPLKTINI